MAWTTVDLRDWRERHKWNKTEAASKLGLHYRYYCMLEASKPKPIRMTVQLACQYYDLAKQQRDAIKY
jgi:DNA-binding XRE family transcriptional regulator